MYGYLSNGQHNPKKDISGLKKNPRGDAFILWNTHFPSTLKGWTALLNIDDKALEPNKGNVVKFQSSQSSYDSCLKIMQKRVEKKSPVASERQSDHKYRNQSSPA